MPIVGSFLRRRRFFRFLEAEIAIGEYMEYLEHEVTGLFSRMRSISATRTYF